MKVAIATAIAVAVSVLVLATRPAAADPGDDAAIADATAAVDPVLVAPAASLDAGQIRALQSRLADWPQLDRYRADDARLRAAAPEPGRVVFLGDSITDAWGRSPGTSFFPGRPYVNRGIGGQTSAQMLVRFQQDVVALRPAAVVILAGTNDIAGNGGRATLPMIEDNLRAMTQLAQANGIRVVLASVLPVAAYPWRAGVHPAAQVCALNRWIRQYAASSGATYLDYHAALADAGGGLRPAFGADGVHPNAAGYAVMAPLAQAAIDAALAR